VRAQEHTKLFFLGTSCADCDAHAVGRILALHQVGQADNCGKHEWAQQ